MSQRVAVVGAGIVGRMLAIRLARAGCQVSLWDQGDRDGRGSCTWTGAGMLAPYCELESRHLLVSRLGLASLSEWPAFLASLDEPVYHQFEGSLIVAHQQDRPELLRMYRAVTERLPDEDIMRRVGDRDIADLEPDLAGRFTNGLFTPVEGQLDNRALLRSLAATLETLGVEWHRGVVVENLAPGTIRVDGEARQVDWVCDCRGMGAAGDQAELRGVRGELVHVRAPEVSLRRPVRVMHPRYPIYVVPRPDHCYVIGATQIESDDDGPISVRSALELLSAAYALHSGFAEATLLETSVACRPAYPDNLPRLERQPGLLRLNGLYRHGFLVAPVMTAAAQAQICGTSPGAAEPPAPLLQAILRQG